METAMMTIPGTIGYTLDNNRVQANQIHILRDGSKLEPDLRSQRACLSGAILLRLALLLACCLFVAFALGLRTWIAQNSRRACARGARGCRHVQCHHAALQSR